MLNEKIKVFERHLGKIDWINSNEGFTECAGQSLHTSKSGKRDCKVWLGPVPTVSCLHTSCRGITNVTNKRIRRLLFMLERGENPDITPDKNREKSKEEIEALKKWKEDRRIEAYARGQKSAWVHAPTWRFDEVIKSDNSKCTLSPQDQYKAFLSLYKDEDVIWIGDVTDSGSDKHKANFRTVREWKEFDLPIGNFTCPSVFKEGSFSRSNANIVVQPYLAIESDILNKDQMCSVARWMDEFITRDDRLGRVKTNALKMMVDTAGRSIHCWVEYPTSESWIYKLKIILPIFGCDPALFKPSQPVRIPGAIRDGKMQSIIWMGSEK